MFEEITGFEILKKADYLEIPPFFDKSIMGKRYEGIDRPGLDEFMEGFYSKKLPKDIQNILERKRNESNDFTLMEIIKDFNDAKTILNYSFGVSHSNEIIAMESNKLSVIKGKFKFYEKRIEWIGYDIISFGCGSLISMGLFFKPHLFQNWISIINKHGLFENKEYLDGYLNSYCIAAKKGEVEDYIRFEDSLGIDMIRIGRIIW